jgi:hypothetical protein
MTSPAAEDRHSASVTFMSWADSKERSIKCPNAGRTVYTSSYRAKCISISDMGIIHITDDQRVACRCLIKTDLRGVALVALGPNRSLPCRHIRALIASSAKASRRRRLHGRVALRPWHSRRLRFVGALVIAHTSSAGQHGGRGAGAVYVD